ncbi:hypothetical protein ASZ90_011155 [hydrocarbon metagenome]|uniref:Uncharacterized protein n=1 Tax=hydrocarbon metagenome TaxID=938273 RepID=A0A0W8FE25_9ZZZZ|nr:hypothetical protein [Methanomicrobiaceae archaeon]
MKTFPEEAFIPERQEGFRRVAGSDACEVEAGPRNPDEATHALA